MVSFLFALHCTIVTLHSSTKLLWNSYISILCEYLCMATHNHKRQPTNDNLQPIKDNHKWKPTTHEREQDDYLPTMALKPVRSLNCAHVRWIGSSELSTCIYFEGCRTRKPSFHDRHTRRMNLAVVMGNVWVRSEVGTDKLHHTNTTCSCAWRHSKMFSAKFLENKFRPVRVLPEVTFESNYCLKEILIKQIYWSNKLTKKN